MLFSFSIFAEPQTQESNHNSKLLLEFSYLSIIVLRYSPDTSKDELCFRERNERL